MSRGTTGHTEVVKVTYDPKKITYEKLLDVFWRNIDPLAANRQFCDVGSQYRSAIFYHDENQTLGDQKALRATFQRAHRDGDCRLPNSIRRRTITRITTSKTRSAINITVTIAAAISARSALGTGCEISCADPKRANDAADYTTGDSKITKEEKSVLKSDCFSNAVPRSSCPSCASW